MGAPPNQPPGNRPYRYDPMTGQMVQDPTPAQPQVAYQQPAVVQPQPQVAYQQPAVMQPQPQAAYQQPAVVQPQAAAPYVAPQQGFQPQAAAYTAPVKKDETMALVALLMAAGAWVLQFHILLSIPAIIVGFMARKKIKADPEKYGGDGLAKIGIIAGFVNVGLWLIGILIAIVMVIISIILNA